MSRILDFDFLVGEAVPLSPDDLKHGLDRGYVQAATAIDLAAREVDNGTDDSLMLDLACLLRDQVDDVGPLLRRLESPDHVHDPRESARKWLYLQLKAAFDRRGQLPDALRTVEEIYAEFDYPKTIEHVVRYMPLRDGDTPGEAALLTRWADFLEEEHVQLRRLSDRS